MEEVNKSKLPLYYHTHLKASSLNLGWGAKVEGWCEGCRATEQRPWLQVVNEGWRGSSKLHSEVSRK